MMIETDSPSIFKEFVSKKLGTNLFNDESKLYEDWDGIDDRDCYITLKTIPNTFKLPLQSIQYPIRNTLHLYKVQVKFQEDRLFLLGGSTSELLYLTLKSLNDIGLAFKNKLSIDIVNYDYDLFLMDAVLKMNLIYMGEYEVNENQLHQIQRFHKAIACQEDIINYNDLLNQHAGFYDYSDISEINKNSTKWVLNDEEWSRSSNGSYYLIFPFKPGSFCEYFNDENIFDLEYLEKCANEAEFTIHNLRIVSLTDTSKEATQVHSTKSCAMLSENDWTHLIVLANNRSLGYIATDNDKNRKSLNSILKYETVYFEKEDDISTNMILSNEKDSNNSSKKVAVTYADYLISKHPYLALSISTKRSDSNHRLLAMNAMSTKVAHFTLLSTIQPHLQDDKGWHERRSIYSDKPERGHFMPEQCRPIGFGHWFYMMKIFPSVIHRIQSLELASEALQLVGDNSIAYEDKNNYKNQFDFRNDHKLDQHNHNQDNNMQDSNKNIHIPHVTTFLEAISPKMSLESFDSERLETLGDTFLKFAITVELYKIKPNFNEGQLTNERVKYINNRRLCHASIDFNLSKYIRAVPLSNGHQRVEFCPPGMCDTNYLRDISIWNTDIMRYPPEFKYDVSTIYNYPVKYHQRHMVMFKKLADMVEAIIGAFYIDCGISGGIRAMKSFELWPNKKTNELSTPMKKVKMKSVNNYNIISNTMKSIPHTHIPLSMTYYVNPIIANYFKSIPTESYYYQPIIVTCKRTMQFPVDNSLESKSKQQIVEKSFNIEMQSILEDHIEINIKNPIHNVNIDDDYDDEDIDIMKMKEVLYTHSEGNCLLRKITRINNNNNIKNSNNYKINNSHSNNNNDLNVMKPKFNKLQSPSKDTSKNGKYQKDNKISELESLLGYEFINKDLLIQALTHSSASSIYNYERLEFLGDAVLDLIVVTYIYNLKTKLEPDMIHKLKSSHLCNRNLAIVGSKLKLQNYIIYNCLSIKKKVDSFNMRYYSSITMIHTQTSSNNNTNNNTNNSNNNDNNSNNNDNSNSNNNSNTNSNNNNSNNSNSNNSNSNIVTSLVNTSMKESMITNKHIYSEHENTYNIKNNLIHDYTMDIINEECYNLIHDYTIDIINEECYRNKDETDMMVENDKQDLTISTCYNIGMLNNNDRVDLMDIDTSNTCMNINNNEIFNNEIINNNQTNINNIDNDVMLMDYTTVNIIKDVLLEEKNNILKDINANNLPYSNNINNSRNSSNHNNNSRNNNNEKKELPCITYEDVDFDLVNDLLADCFEAIIGAMFLDSNENIEIIQEVIEKQELLIFEYI